MKLGNQKSVFRCNLTHVVAFCRLNRPFGPTAGVRNSHFSGGRIFKNTSVHLNPRIEGTEIVCPQFSGGRFCQVVARTGSTVRSIQNAIFLSGTNGSTCKLDATSSFGCSRSSCSGHRENIPGN